MLLQHDKTLYEGLEPAANRNPHRSRQGRFFSIITALLLAALVAAGPAAAASHAAPAGNKSPAGPTESETIAENPSGSSPDTTAGEAARTLSIARIENEAPPVNGRLDHPAWQQAPAASSFIQALPDEGEPASERTEVRVLYDDQALYVGARMHQEDTGQITAPVLSRDQWSSSDRFYVAIDSYDDGRTGFVFGVNPQGSRVDRLIYDESQIDNDWSAVWEADAQIDEQGWTAVIRIPFSQLRFQGDDPGSWGVNFQRELADRGEMSFWSPVTMDDRRLVPYFGRLTGINPPQQNLRLEAEPYVTAGLTRVSESIRTPMQQPLEASYDVGGNLQYGVSPQMTLTSTINPDFGQVEQDPAVVDLSAFEVFQSERRPFFQEGTEIFDFDGTRTNNAHRRPNTFYSRRIGQAPQVRVSDPEYQDVQQPRQTRILNATKLSGQTGSWSTGVMSALTAREHAEALDQQDRVHRYEVAPPTHHFIGVAENRFNGSRSRAGVQAGALHRFQDSELLQSRLVDESYIGGLSLEHQFGPEREWAVSGVMQASHVSGSAEAIANKQNDPARYFGRPDADHLSFDPERRSLTGTATELSVARMQGPLTGSLTYNRVGPEFDADELGFQRHGDLQAVSGNVSYLKPGPASFLQRINLSLDSHAAWDHGGNLTEMPVSGMALFGFSNNWMLQLRGMAEPETRDTHLTRGGPVARSPANGVAATRVMSDRSRDFHASLLAMRRWYSGDGMQSRLEVDFTWRPSASLTFSVNPGYTRSEGVTQYTGAVGDEHASHTYGTRYLFADLDMHILEAGIRAEWTPHPDMSLQLFTQPLLSAASFSGFKELSRPDSFDFDTYGRDKGRVERGDGQVSLHPDRGEAIQMRDPDFVRRSLRSSAVFRWDYLPGSSLYLVWQLNQQDRDGLSRLDLQRDYRQMMSAPSRNQLQFKLTFWLDR